MEIISILGIETKAWSDGLKRWHLMNRRLKQIVGSAIIKAINCNWWRIL